MQDNRKHNIPYKHQLENLLLDRLHVDNKYMDGLEIIDIKQNFEYETYIVLKVSMSIHYQNQPNYSLEEKKFKEHFYFSFTDQDIYRFHHLDVLLDIDVIANPKKKRKDNIKPEENYLKENNNVRLVEYDLN